MLGKHSGKGGVQAVYSMLGKEVSDDEAKRLIAEVRNFVNSAKRPPLPGELLTMFEVLQTKTGDNTSCATQSFDSN